MCIRDRIRDQGSYTITKIQNGSWGKLLSGAGWINCHTKYCTYGGTATPQNDAKKQTIAVDGVWGSELTLRLQEIFGTPKDGRISNQPTSNREYCAGITVVEWSTKLSGGSTLIKKMQEWAETTADGYIGPQTLSLIHISKALTEKMEKRRIFTSNILRFRIRPLRLR